MADDGLDVVLENMTGWIHMHTVILLAAAAVMALVMCVVCYKKGETISKQFQSCTDDEGQAQLDGHYNFWSMTGTVATTMIIYFSLGILAFGFRLENDRDAMRLLVSSALLIVITVVCVFYQIAVVKQIRKKDPMKRGDAADLAFCKEWLKSCDEAERYIIYEAGYKTYSETKIILLAAAVIAMTGELILGGGLAAAVLLLLCNMLSTVLYAVHSVRMEKQRYCL